MKRKMNRAFLFGMRARLSRGLLGLVLTAAVFFTADNACARKMHNKECRFKMALAETMLSVKPANDTLPGEEYYDSVACVTMIISWRPSTFHSVDEYLNCSRKELENILKDCIADTSLRIVSCNTEKNRAILDFTVNSSIEGRENNIIYFVHHRKKDIQFSFVCKNVCTSDEKEYIKSTMKTLKLR